jgi:hypothetical protein
MGSRRFWAVVAVIWALFGLITGFQVWISMITHGHMRSPDASSV